MRPSDPDRREVDAHRAVGLFADDDEVDVGRIGDSVEADVDVLCGGDGARGGEKGDEGGRADDAVDSHGADPLAGRGAGEAGR